MFNQLSDLEQKQLKIARVILNANGTEGIINKYIAEFYTHNSSGDYEESYLAFRYDILSNGYISLSSKSDILFNIFKKIDSADRIKGTISRRTFETWMKIRNKFAHGELISYNGSGRLSYNGRIYRVEPLIDDFAKCNRKILMALHKYNEELEGLYFSVMRATKESAL